MPQAKVFLSFDEVDIAYNPKVPRITRVRVKPIPKRFESYFAEMTDQIRAMKQNPAWRQAPEYANITDDATAFGLELQRPP